MNQKNTDKHPCASCLRYRGDRVDIDTTNALINEGVAGLLNDEEEGMGPIELGNLGNIVDAVADGMSCRGPKFSIPIGRVSLLTVCRRTWEQGNPVTAVIQAVFPP